MALSDYIANRPQTGVPFTEKAPAINTLAAVDTQMRDAQQAAQIRGRREELQTKIANLKAQNDELRARRDKIKANSLSDMDEDKVVAMAKAKGIRNEDIEAWLRGRAQRSARDISRGQTEVLQRQAEAMKDETKQKDVQAIYDLAAELISAEKAVPDEKLREKDAIVKSKRNKLATLKRNFLKAYGETWEAFTGSEEEPTAGKKKGPQGAQEGQQAPVVTLTEEEIAVLDEPTRAKIDEPTATNEEKRKIKAEAQKKIREKGEADRRREEQLAGIKKDLAAIGATSGMNAAKIVNGFDRSADRNDPVKRAAVARIKKFVGSDKDFKSWKSLDTLFK